MRNVEANAEGIGGRAGMSARHPAAERCGSPSIRKLLIVYGLNRATELEREAFELHVLSCRTCFDDLAAVRRAAQLIDDWMRRPGDRPEGMTSLLRAARLRRILLVGLAVAAAAAVGFFFRTAF